MPIAPKATEPEVDLGPATPFRFLTFIDLDHGRRYVASFADHLFELRQDRAGERPCWRAAIAAKTDIFAVARRKFFRELDEAKDYLEAEARRLAGGAA